MTNSNINRRRSKPLHISVFLRDATAYLLEKTDAASDTRQIKELPPRLLSSEGERNEVSTTTMEANPHD